MNFAGPLVLGGGSDIRAPLLQALVDLYLQKPLHTEEEERHFTELALRLLDNSPVETRIAIASSLASYSAVPAAVAQRLADDLPQVVAALRGPPPSKHIAPPAVRRPPSAAELTSLFFAAPAEDRRLILLNLSYVAPAIAERKPLGTPKNAARRLEIAALSRRADATANVIGQWLGIAPALARRIVRDPLGEPIVAVAKALEITTATLERVLLFLNPSIGRSVRLVYDLVTLFEEIELGAALTLVELWRAAEPRKARTPPSEPPHGTTRARYQASAATATAVRPEARARAAGKMC
jgi:hypothetical protein